MRSYSRYAILVVLASCTSSPGSGNQPPPLGGALTIQGQVLDFQTNQPIGVMPDIEVTGANAAQVSVDNADFTIKDVPDNSSFQILATASPTYAPTYSPAIYVTTSDVTGAKAYAVSASYLGQLESGFGISALSSNGIVLMQLVDSSGAAKSGVAGSNIVLAGSTGASGPHFLDASLAPSTATSSSASGWAVFFNVPAGAVALGQAANATVTLSMTESPVAAGTVTITTVTVTSGAPPPPPMNVSFSAQVVPIFDARGCTACHSGNKIGANLGDLALDGGANHIYSQLTNPQHPMIVQTANPSKSLVLTMPSYENPPDAHPNVTFTGPQDPDYMKILAWITAGAQNN
jgi:hypothetical protein